MIYTLTTNVNVPMDTGVQTVPVSYIGLKIFRTIRCIKMIESVDDFKLCWSFLFNLLLFKKNAKTKCNAIVLETPALFFYFYYKYLCWLISDRNECILDSPCQNNGRCEDTMDSYRCVCPDFVAGPNCEGKNVQYCAESG